MLPVRPSARDFVPSTQGSMFAAARTGDRRGDDPWDGSMTLLISSRMPPTSWPTWRREASPAAIAAAVSEIPVVGDVVEAAAPFGGMIGTLLGGPVGGAIGGAVGDAFGDGGGGGGCSASRRRHRRDRRRVARPARRHRRRPARRRLADRRRRFDPQRWGLRRPRRLTGAAGGLLGGDLGGLADAAGGLLGGDLGGLADAAGGLLGGDFGGILGQASSVFGGLGLGDLDSAVAGHHRGLHGGGLSDPGGWLGSLTLDGIPGSRWRWFDLPFGLGTSRRSPTSPARSAQAGGGWLEHIAAAGRRGRRAARRIRGGGWFERADRQARGLSPRPRSAICPSTRWTSSRSRRPARRIRPSRSIDDLIGQLPGVGDVPGSVQEKLQSLVETGNLGEALGNLSSNELTHSCPSSSSPGRPPDRHRHAATVGRHVAGADDGRGGSRRPTTSVSTPSRRPSGPRQTGREPCGCRRDRRVQPRRPVDRDARRRPRRSRRPPAPCEMPAHRNRSRSRPSDFSQEFAQADAVEESFDEHVRRPGSQG